MTEPEGAQPGLKLLGSAGRDAGHHRHMFGDHAVVREGRLEADVGSSPNAIGDQEWMRLDLAVWSVQDIQATPELDQLAGVDPPHELKPELAGGHSDNVKQRRREYRLIADQLQ